MSHHALSRLRLGLALGTALGVALPTAGCIQVAEQPDLAGQDVHLTLIHTADLHSRFFPYEFAPGQIDRNLGLVPKNGDLAVVGGISRIATVVKNIRNTRDRVLHLDTGDIFQGAPVFNVFNGEVEIRAMTQLGLDAMALGNHEFDRGVTNLVLLKQQYAGFPILAANYLFSDPNDPAQPKLARVIAPYTIFNASGLKVAVIGMGNLSSLQGIYEGGNSLGIRPLETVQVVQDTVRLLREQVDVVVLVSHLGLEEDEDLAQSNPDKVDDGNEQLAALDGVDVVLGGHLHIVLNPPNRLEHPPKMVDGKLVDGGFTVVAHSGAFAKFVGQLDLVVHVGDSRSRCEDRRLCTSDADCGEGGTCKPADAQERRSRVKTFTYNLVPIDDQIPEDPDMNDMLEPYRIQLSLRLNLGEKYAVVPCAGTGSSCPKVLRNDPTGGDSQLGNLVTGAMRLRRRVEADFALTNSLGIRTDFESGPLDLEQMFNVFPFDNTITTIFLSGLEIQETLDFLAARAGERGCRTQAQVSGLWFVTDCTHKISCGPFDAQGNLANECHPSDRQLNPTDPSRLDGPPLIGDDCRNHPENCTPVLPFASYRVAVNDYIANGGSGFAVLKRNTTKFNTGISLRDALIDYIRTLPDRCSTADFPTLVDPQAGQPCTQNEDCASRQCVGTDNKTCASSYDFSTLPCLLPEGVAGHDDRIRMVSP
jgi:5'-nucleotidase/UDP-sugar diphosphatase